MSASLQSQLVLEFSGEGETTRLTRRQAGGLCHIGKPYFDDNVLTLQLVNPTAGFFAGDLLDIRIKLGDSSQVALTSPSASRYHTTDGGVSTVRQKFTLGEECWLDWWPEIVIPQGKSDSVLRTEIHLTESSEMVFLDLLAPGRVAFGENVEFRRFETRFDLFKNQTQLVRERCVVEPEKSLWPLEMPEWETCYYGVVWIAGPRAEAALGAVENSEWQSGSLLDAHLAVIRFLAPDSVELRRKASELRQDLKKVLPRLATDFRKL